MPRLSVVLLMVLPLACAHGAGPATSATTKPATKPTTKPTSRPVVREWHPRPYPPNEVNLIAMGDWGTNNNNQKIVAMALAHYVDGTQRQFNGAVLEGDNFYGKLTGIDDYSWQSMFEDMYDPERLAFPFYAALGNHDYESGKNKIELEYAAKNPKSRWKMPSRWYRVDFPADHPLVSVLMLDSDLPKLTKEEWAQQVRFIDEQLSNKRGAKWTMACAHHPIFSNGSHGDNGVLMTDWGSLFQKHKLDFYVCGHDHDLQHLQVEKWWPSFILAGGGGQKPTEMRRDIRGPFSKRYMGFAHMQFFPNRAVIRFINGEDGKLVHEFIRDSRGQVQIAYTSGRDKATTKPLKAILGFEELDSATTKPTTK